MYRILCYTLIESRTELPQKSAALWFITYELIIRFTNYLGNIERQALFRDKLERYTSLLHDIIVELNEPLIIPVGLDALGLNGDDQHLSVALLEKNTWPDLWGCQSIPLEEIISTLNSKNLPFIEKENCITVDLKSLGTTGSISFSKPTHNTNAILSAQWINFVARLSPQVWLAFLENIPCGQR